MAFSSVWWRAPLPATYARRRACANPVRESVEDVHEAERVRRRGRPGPGALRAGEQRLEAGEGQRTAGDGQHRADERADHVAQEGVGGDREHGLLALVPPGGCEDLAPEDPVLRL